MRLLITLENNKKTIVNNNTNNNYHIQSFIYNQLRNTNFNDLHDFKKRAGVPSFCFSNLFHSSQKNEFIRKLIISSPNEELIKLLSKQVSRLHFLSFGNISFKILDVSVFRLAVSKLKHVHTSTPIITRIPKTKLEDYHLNLEKSYSYIYWRKDFPIEIFFEQLTQNMGRKYYNYHGKHPRSPLKFEWFSLKKQISTQLQIHDNSHIIIGSLWEFVMDETLDDTMLDFCIETGFGERNTMGFGFINPVRT